LKEIEHVDSVDYYWELDGILNNKEVLVVPKSNIENIVISSSLSKSFHTGTLISYLTLDNQNYVFKMNIDEYKVKDYPRPDNVDKEVIYMPLNMMKDMLKKENITKSSAVVVYCDDLSHVSKTLSTIKRWMNQVTVSSAGLKYNESIESLKTLKQFMVALRMIMVAGVIAVAFIGESMKNKSREKEINNLRINGMDKKSFYSLSYYENNLFIIMTIALCGFGYIAISLIMNLSISFVSFMTILIKAIIYIFITRIVPLIILIQVLMKKDISTILRKD
jgi:hypothetical protein